MFNIKLFNKISQAGLEVFDRDRYTCLEEIENPDAILVRSANLHEVQFEPTVRAIARAGAGVNNIPLERCAAEGIVVFNTPGANANAVCELVVAGLLISSRKIVPGIDWAKTLKGSGDEVAALVEKGKGKFVGPELRGKTLGVIGLGAIGVKVANIARHFGMKVYGYDPYLSVDAAWNLSREIVHAKSLKEIYENSDYITIHVPQTKETKGMINSESIKSMKNGVKILNLARGTLVDNEGILAALEEGKVSCYVTDFPSEELLGAKNVIAIPHLGASTPESEDNCACMAAQELIDYLENGNIVNSVNLPGVSMDRTGDLRLGVIHKNIPNTISKFSQCLAASGANIENMTDKSRGDYAYALVDVTGEVPQATLDAIDQIDGVIRVTLFR